MGYAPAAESAEGDVLITRAGCPPHSAPYAAHAGPRGPAGPGRHAADGGGPGHPGLRHRRQGRAPGVRGHGLSHGGLPPRTTAAETLATVQAAAMTGSAVWIGYVNADGAASQRVIAPVKVEGGFVTAYDHTADEVRTYPLHRITGVAELADDQAT